MNNTAKLDEIIQEIEREYIVVDTLTNQEVRDKAKQALIQWRNEWALELIGKYDRFNHPEDFTPIKDKRFQNRNALRYELRRKIEQAHD